MAEQAVLILVDLWLGLFPCPGVCTTSVRSLYSSRIRVQKQGVRREQLKVWLTKQTGSGKPPEPARQPGPLGEYTQCLSMITRRAEVGVL